MMYTTVPLLLVLLVASCQAGPEKDDLKNCVCAKGWTQLGQKCLKFIDKMSQWQDAKHYCEKLGATLAQPKTTKENGYLTIIRNENGGPSLWIGLRNKRFGDESTRDGGTHWVDNTKADRAKFPPGTSNNRYYTERVPDRNSKMYTEYTFEDCFHMSAQRYNTAWNDMDCKSEHKFVCEKEISPQHRCHCPSGFELFSKKCYMYMGKAGHWGAIWDCWFRNNSWHSYLALPKTSLENRYLSYLRDTRNGGEYMWLGFTTVESNLLPWYPIGSNINDNKADEDCFHLRSKNHGLKWKAGQCGTKLKLGFVCENDFISPVPAKDMCEEGWIMFEKCYKHMGVVGNWDTAYKTCKESGARLAMPKKLQENGYLSSIRDMNAGKQIWIGMRRGYEKRFGKVINRWQDDAKTMLNDDDAPRGSNINHNLYNEHCYHMSAKKYNDAWNAVPCNTKMGFVCEKDSSTRL